MKQFLDVVIKKLQGSFKSGAETSQEGVKVVLGKFQGCIKSISKVLP